MRPVLTQMRLKNKFRRFLSLGTRMIQLNKLRYLNGHFSLGTRMIYPYMIDFNFYKANLNGVLS